MRTGRDGSSVVGTVRATCGMGEFSSGGGDFDDEACSWLGTEIRGEKREEDE